MSAYPWPFTVYILLLDAVLGAVLASFLDCLACRVLAGQTMWGRSQCPACRHPLRPRDLIPVFSYLQLHGRCRYCGQPIPSRCLWTELLLAAFFVAVVLRFGLAWATVKWLLFGCLLLAVAAADLEAQLIPDGFLVAGLVLRLLFVFTEGNIGPDALSALLGAVSISLPLLLLVLLLDKVWGRETMGGGDIKLLFVIGSFFPWQQNLLTLLLACLLGLIFAFAARKRGRSFPFAPAISAAAALTVLVGQPLVHWYLSFF